jgi:hypothetical protein
MKMLIVNSIKEDLQAVQQLFEEAKIPVFSVSETVGHKTEHSNDLLNNWFAQGDVSTDSLFFFSFTSDTKAKEGLQLIKIYNQNNPSNFPLRAFLLPVEDCSY